MREQAVGPIDPGACGGKRLRRAEGLHIVLGGKQLRRSIRRFIIDDKKTPNTQTPVIIEKSG
jgi:hypothetical protein